RRRPYRTARGPDRAERPRGTAPCPPGTRGTRGDGGGQPSAQPRGVAVLRAASMDRRVHRAGITAFPDLDVRWRRLAGLRPTTTGPVAPPLPGGGQALLLLRPCPRTERLGGDPGCPCRQPQGGRMRVAVFGATGGTGEQIIRRALAAGHRVSAFARRPEALWTLFPDLDVVRGDFDDGDAVHATVVDTDAVISAVGSHTMKPGTTVYSRGTRAILAAMDEAGPHRFVGVSAAPIAPDAHKSGLERHVVHPLLHRFFGGGYDDMRVMEDLLAASECDWTVFRPPRLTD